MYILNIVTFQYTISFTSFTGKAAIFYDFQPVGYLPVSYKFLTLENEEMNPWPWDYKLISEPHQSILELVQPYSLRWGLWYWSQYLSVETRVHVITWDYLKCAWLIRILGTCIADFFPNTKLIWRKIACSCIYFLHNKHILCFKF